MPKDSIKSINNQMKVYINEAGSISDKCKKKLLKLVEKYFYVELPNENYKNIDITILENGNISMRDIEYKTSNNLSSPDEIFKRFSEFQEEAEKILDNNATNFSTMKKNNEISNLLTVTLILIIALVIVIFSIRELLGGNFFGFLYIVFIIGYYILPASGNRFRDRLKKATKYIKSIFTKK